MGQAVAGIFQALSCAECAKYVCNAADSECSSDCCESPCTCKFATHETGDESPDLIEKEIHERQYTIRGG